MKKWIACRACIEESFPGYKKQMLDGREVLYECDCHKTWREARDIELLLKEASLSYSDFMLYYHPDKDYIGNKEIAKKVSNLVSSFIKEEISHIAYFYGKQGTQKTTVAQWVGSQLVRAGKHVFYISMQKFLEETIGFDDKKVLRKSFFETVPVLIIDDSFSISRVSLFKNSNYQLAPLNIFFRERLSSNKPLHTIIVSDTEIKDLKLSGFGKDIEQLLFSRSSVLTFPDEYNKIISSFDPKKDIFGGDA